MCNFLALPKGGVGRRLLNGSNKLLADAAHFKVIYTEALRQRGIYASLMTAQKNPPL